MNKNGKKCKIPRQIYQCKGIDNSTGEEIVPNAIHKKKKSIRKFVFNSKNIQEDANNSIIHEENNSETPPRCNYQLLTSNNIKENIIPIVEEEYFYQTQCTPEINIKIPDLENNCTTHSPLMIPITDETCLSNNIFLNKFRLQCQYC